MEGNYTLTVMSNARTKLQSVWPPRWMSSGGDDDDDLADLDLSKTLQILQKKYKEYESGDSSSSGGGGKGGKDMDIELGGKGMKNKPNFRTSQKPNLTPI